MNWILNIDSAVQTASICLAKDGQQVGFKINAAQADHASWLQPAIASLVLEQRMDIRSLDAIAVSAGPGSYTGLRVGMATAKGLCYTLNKPLILINTLRMMAVSALSEPSALFICPMIDARRMEVFTAVFDHSLNEIVAPHNIILSGDSFVEILNRGPVVFFGNGSEKFKNLTAHENALFKNLASTAEQMVSLSYQSFLDKSFADLAYSEPFYGKEFYSPAVIKS